MTVQKIHNHIQKSKPPFNIKINKGTRKQQKFTGLQIGEFFKTFLGSHLHRSPSKLYIINISIFNTIL